MLSSVGIRPLLSSEYICTPGTGIFTHWRATIKYDILLEKPLSRHQKPWNQRWMTKLSYFGSALRGWRSGAPLLLRFSRELEKEDRISFWQLLGLNAVQAALPAAELWFSTELIAIAHAASTGESMAFSHKFFIVLVGRLSTAIVSLLVERACFALEQALTSTFGLRVQTQILRLHCTLTDAQLDTPAMKRHLFLLRELGGGSASSMYRRVFDPVGAIGVVSGIAGVVMSSVVLVRQVSGRNALLLAVSMGFMALEEWDSWNANQPVIEHYDVTNDAWTRFQNMFRLGVSRRHRPEMTMLGIHPYILSSALNARNQLTSSISNGRAICAPSPLHQPAPLRPLTILLALSRPLSTAIFILHASTTTSRNGLVSLAELAVLEKACWTLRVKWASLSRGVREVQGGLEKLAALYACEVSIVSSPEEEPRHQEIEDRQSAQSREGLALSFRDVELKYDDEAIPALDSVSFDVLPGQIVAICGQNGSGKTSLVSLLAGIKTWTAGEILLDHRSFDSFSTVERAQMMNFTLQSSSALPMSIREYVSLGARAGRPSSDPEELSGIDAMICKALASTTASEVVEQLEDGDLAYPAGSGDTDEWTQLPQLVLREPPVPTLELLSLGGGKSDDHCAGRAEEEEESDALGTSDHTLVDDSAQDGRIDDGGKRKVSLRKRPAQVQWIAIPTLLPDGQEASVNFPLHAPGRVALSGGQWQRIALARSLCAGEDNRLLVLDEPAAALDPIAEGALFDALERLRGKCTVLFTTHRLSACLKADKVLLFDQGRLIEQGSPEQLRQRPGGAFARLYNMQAAAYAPAAGHSSTVRVDV